MAKHSLAEAEGRLAELIERAQRGEEVVITRGEEPVAEIRAVQDSGDTPKPSATLPEIMDWLASRRAKRAVSSVDAGTLVSRMRDEEER